MIVSSTYTESDFQADGSRTITAQLINDDGQVFGYFWQSKNDPAYVITALTERLNEQFLAKAEAQTIADRIQLPLTKFEFRSLFTLQERMNIDAFNVKYESNQNLSDAQKAMIRTGLNDFDAALNIALPFLDSVIAMINLYQSVGILTDQRAAEILSRGANG